MPETALERYNPLAIAAVCTRSFRDAIQRISRYKQLTCPEEIKLRERGDECEVHFRWLLAHERRTECPGGSVFLLDTEHCASGKR